MISKLANYVIRPQRLLYNPRKDLGPSLFYIDEMPCGRNDFKVVNQRKQTILCSLYHRTINMHKKRPCVFYCHGNSGNRTDCFESLRPLLSQDIVVVCFDFPGCGLSDGEVVSLGYYEHFNIECVVNFVLEQFDFIDPNSLGIWGRSMGAVAGIYYAARTNKIKAMVLDSPFSSFPELMQDYFDRHKLIAKITGTYIERKLREKIREQANFDIQNLLPINQVSKIRCPVIFLHGENDSLVLIRHSRALFEQIQGEKDFIAVEGGHNDARPESINENLKQFWGRQLIENATPTLSFKGGRPFEVMSVWNSKKIDSLVQDRFGQPDINKDNETQTFGKFDDTVEKGSLQDVSFKRKEKRRFGMIPVLKSGDQETQAVARQKEASPKEEEEYEELSFVPRERLNRRSKLFFLVRKDALKLPPQIDRTDSSNIIDAIDPQPQLSKKFELLVEGNRMQTASKKIYLNSGSKSPELVMASDVHQLIQLDEVFSNIQADINRDQIIEEPLSKIGFPYKQLAETRTIALEGDADNLIDTGSESPGPGRRR